MEPSAIQIPLYGYGQLTAIQTFTLMYTVTNAMIVGTELSFQSSVNYSHNIELCYVDSCFARILFYQSTRCPQFDQWLADKEWKGEPRRTNDIISHAMSQLQ